MKKFIIENKKILLYLCLSFVMAFLLAGSIFFFYHEREVEKEKIKMDLQNEKLKRKLEKKTEKMEENLLEKKEDVFKESSTNNGNTVLDSNENSSSNGANQGEVVGDEEGVIAYFLEQERTASLNEQDASVRERLKNGVNTIYQFLFHGGTIQGKSFQELSSRAKLQVLKIALSIDSKIDSYFPNYKQSIKQGASNLKSKIVVAYLETTNKICSNYENTCTEAREDFKKLKENFKVTFSLIAGVVKEGGVAIKEWYLSTK